MDKGTCLSTPGNFPAGKRSETHRNVQRLRVAKKIPWRGKESEKADWMKEEAYFLSYEASKLFLSPERYFIIITVHLPFYFSHNYRGCTKRSPATTVAISAANRRFPRIFDKIRKSNWDVIFFFGITLYYFLSKYNLKDIIFFFVSISKKKE